ncbi:MAG TPA: glycosyltransferase, partial [Prosthecobacter sp.]|nr:glycosyltransferase [Prosthecobacter sp.]
NFSMIIFCEMQAPGYYAMVMKRLGMAFADTALLMHTHSSTLWHRLANADGFSNRALLRLAFAERRSIQLADALISPSAYLVRWMRRNGYELPQHVYVQPYIVGKHVYQDNPLELVGTKCPVSELVFFGRLEIRKGIDVFCSAIDAITNSIPEDVKITFMGKCVYIGDEHSVQYILRRSAKWRQKIRIEARFTQWEAISYLKQPGRLAVICSRRDNSPNTVYECIWSEIPFIASNVGGIPEIIHEADRPHCLFDFNASGLAERLDILVRQGALLVRPAIDPKENSTRWVQGLIELSAAHSGRAPAMDPQSRPLVTVVLTHFNRPSYLPQAINSLLAQTYPNIEVVLVDDGSTMPEAVALLDILEPAFESRGWKLIRERNRYPGAARNSGARLASGEYILFMDDDNIAFRDEVEVFVNAALFSGADVLTCWSHVFSGDSEPDDDTVVLEEVRMLGPSLSVAMYENCIGDTNSFFKKGAFWSLGGFTEDYGIGSEDYELLVKAVAAGLDVEAIPKALFWYRRSPEGVNSVTNLYANGFRSLRPILDSVPKPLREALLHARSLKIDEDSRWIESRRGGSDPLVEKLRSAGDPDGVNALSAAAMLAVERGKYDLAANLLMSLLKDDRYNYKAWALLRKALLEAGRVAEMIEVGLILDEIFVDVEALYFIKMHEAMYIVDGDDKYRKMAIYQELLHTFPSIPDAYYAYSHVLRSNGMQNDAEYWRSKGDDAAEAYYLQRSPDVASGVRNGFFPSAKDHYLRFGKSEKFRSWLKFPELQPAPLNF